MRLGQPLNTLSGGESQRLKLVSHLNVLKAPKERTKLSARQAAIVLIFDEPTTGLHFDDVALLMKVFQRLVDAGNTVLVIEHNLEVIKCADWIVDLGPEAGDEGGQVVAAGTPSAISKDRGPMHTGHYLRSHSLTNSG